MIDEIKIASCYIVVVALLCWLLYWLINSCLQKRPKEKSPSKSISPENYGAMIDQRAENARLHRALDLAGIPAQAALDDKAPPLRVNVKQAREIMKVADGNV